MSDTHFTCSGSSPGNVGKGFAFSGGSPGVGSGFSFSGNSPTSPSVYPSLRAPSGRALSEKVSCSPHDAVVCLINRLAHFDVCAGGKRLTRYERGTKMSDTKARIQNRVYPDAKATEKGKFAAEGGAR
jgi:hypothetical protein